MPASRGWITFLVAAVLSGPAFAQAPEESFIERFDGVWSGRGSVQRDIDRSPWRVSCNVKGNSGGERIAINGTCRAAVIASRSFGADIRYDRRSKRYVGTYTGAKVGPAKLSGRRRGDAVVMTVTWPKPVYGDTTATLTIRNGGDGRMNIVMTDKVQSGRVETTTDIMLAEQ
jgi:hypothetical protein